MKEDSFSGYAEYTPLDTRFYPILGSNNGANTMRLLCDHKDGLGSHRIETIVLLGGPAVSDSRRNIDSNLRRISQSLL